MSLNRYAPKRDSNEKQIRARFAHHGWHTEQLSGSGMPDLLAVTWHTRDSMNVPWRSMVLVDVKEPKGKVTPAQEKKWAALLEKGIPVYVARTDADVDAIASGTAEAWRPEKPRAPIAKPMAKSGYIPPRGPGVDAATQAGETFAPAPCPACAINPQNPCKHDGEEKGVALGNVPPRRLNQRPVDKIMAKKGRRSRSGS
jgi:hypothetical protein